MSSKNNIICIKCQNSVSNTKKIYMLKNNQEIIMCPYCFNQCREWYRMGENIGIIKKAKL